MSTAHDVLPAEVSQFLGTAGRGVFIDGRWREPRSATTFATLNPATNQAIYDVAEASAAEVDDAVLAARRALERGPWPDMLPDERCRIIWRIADLLESRAEEFAVLETLDNGKPLTAARSDVADAARWFRYYAGWTSKVTGSTIPVNTPNTLVYTMRQPVGVCGLIVPWNYPLGMAAWKLAPALACGCTMILKPAEQTPLSALLLAEVSRDAGVPSGVINVVAGAGSVGAALVRHADIDKIAFTGSTEVAKEIMAASGGARMKRVSVEAGGKSPNVIFADADLDAAKEGAAFAIFHNLGQDCTAGSRLFVEAAVYDEVVDHLVQRASSLVVGPGLVPGSDLGPVVSAVQLERVLGYIELGEREGATLRSGGHRLVEGALAAGNFAQPTVFTEARSDMRVSQEEIFGPVVVVQRFDDVDHVIDEANATSFGLGAGVWTSSLSRAHRLARAIHSGTVWVNTYNSVEPSVPFGGFKDSGVGREHGWSGIELYSEVKSVWINHSSPVSVLSLTAPAVEP